jgi:hypothetical protein
MGAGAIYDAEVGVWQNYGRRGDGKETLRTQSIIPILLAISKDITPYHTESEPLRPTPS